MNNTILELAKSYLGDAFSQDASTKLNESSDGITKALGAIVPAIFAGVSRKANTDASFMSTVFSLAKNIFTNGSLNNLNNVFGSNQNSSATQAGTFVRNLFGNGFHSIVEKISSYAGIKPSSTRDLFEASSIASLGSVGRDAVENGSTVSSIIDFFKNNESSFLSAIPASLGLTSLLTNVDASVTGGTEHTTVQQEPAADYNRHDPEDKKSGNKFLIPLLLALVAVALLLFLLKQCNKTHDEVTTAIDSTTVTAADTIAARPALTTTSREPLVVTLPSGQTVQAYKGGIEDQVVTFLKSPEYASATEEQLKDRWFNFDNINFEFGTSKLTPESQVQFDNLVAILKEFPDAKVKVGAYTDKKGEDAANLKLSQERANAIKNALAAAGTQIAGAEGYGEKFATVPETADDQAREVDRKTAIRFVK